MVSVPARLVAGRVAVAPDVSQDPASYSLIIGDDASPPALSGDNAAVPAHALAGSMADYGRLSYQRPFVLPNLAQVTDFKSQNEEKHYNTEDRQRSKRTDAHDACPALLTATGTPKSHLYKAWYRAYQVLPVLRDIQQVIRHAGPAAICDDGAAVGMLGGASAFRASGAGKASCGKAMIGIPMQPMRRETIDSVDTRAAALPLHGEGAGLRAFPDADVMDTGEPFWTQVVTRCFTASVKPPCSRCSGNGQGETADHAFPHALRGCPPSGRIGTGRQWFRQASALNRYQFNAQKHIFSMGWSVVVSLIECSTP